eukprot:2419160-Pleurochrysis_carterae.AAC.1
MFPPRQPARIPAVCRILHRPRHPRGLRRRHQVGREARQLVVLAQVSLSRWWHGLRALGLAPAAQSRR